MLRIVHIDAPQGPTSYNLLAERDYTIGRNEGDIKFPHDPSMKKRHAKLEVSHSIGNLANPMITPTIAITPIVRGAIITATNRGSDEAFDIGEKADIGDGQKFSLGGIPNVFEIHYTPFVAVFSGRIQGEIQLQIQQLGGHSLRQWCKDATHLVTDEVELSLDVCGALLAGKPLVTQGFITKLLSFYKKEINTKPDPQDYLPLVAARSLDTNEPIPASAFKPNPDRASLFQGKTFVLRTMPLLNDSKAVIAAGGGEAKWVLDRTLPSILDENHIIMGEPIDIKIAKTNSRCKQIYEKYFNGPSKRIVNAKELGMAAIHGSIAKFCNPDAELLSVKQESVNI